MRSRGASQIDPAANRLIVIGRPLIVADGLGQPRHLLADLNREIAEMDPRTAQRRNQNAGEDRVRIGVGIAQAVEGSLADPGRVKREHPAHRLDAPETAFSADAAHVGSPEGIVGRTWPRGGADEIGDQPHEPERRDTASELKAGAPVRGEVAGRWILPVPGHPRPKAVPLARRVEPRCPGGARNGNFTDGTWTAEAIEERKWLRTCPILRKTGERVMRAGSKKPIVPVADGTRRPPVRVKLARITANHSKAYPPDGETRAWWDRLKRALGTSSSAFVSASLAQLQSAARLPFSGISETALNAALLRLRCIAGTGPEAERGEAARGAAHRSPLSLGGSPPATGRSTRHMSGPQFPRPEENEVDSNLWGRRRTLCHFDMVESERMGPRL